MLTLDVVVVVVIVVVVVHRKACLGGLSKDDGKQRGVIACSSILRRRRRQSWMVDRALRWWELLPSRGRGRGGCGKELFLSRGSDHLLLILVVNHHRQPRFLAVGRGYRHRGLENRRSVVEHRSSATGPSLHTDSDAVLFIVAHMNIFRDVAVRFHKSCCGIHLLILLIIINFKQC